MRIRIIIAGAFLFLSVLRSEAKGIVASQIDSVNFKACVASLPKGITVNLSDIARYFIDKPYVAGTLDKSGDEKLVVNLRQFDCTTLVESCMAIYETMLTGYKSFSNYFIQLRMIRYRDGKIDGYTSRLHYMTDWIFENKRRRVLTDITPDLGGAVMNKRIDFMSTHPNTYKQLKDDSVNIEKMMIVEDNINARQDYIVLPKSKIKGIEGKIKDGDIILFASGSEGLDYSHAGIAFHNYGKLTFIHASSKAKRVIIEPKTLANYCKDSKSLTGITVLRMNY